MSNYCIEPGCFHSEYKRGYCLFHIDAHQSYIQDFTISLLQPRYTYDPTEYELVKKETQLDRIEQKLDELLQKASSQNF